MPAKKGYRVEMLGGVARFTASRTGPQTIRAVGVFTRELGVVGRVDVGFKADIELQAKLTDKTGLVGQAAAVGRDLQDMLRTLERLGKPQGGRG